MSEMSQTADHLLVIGRGRIIAAGPVEQVIDSVAGGAVRVRSPRAGELAAALAADGATVTSLEAGMGDATPLESTWMPHTTPSRLRELWAPCGHGTRTSRSKIKRHAVDLGIHRWGGWGSNPRPRDYESHALTS
jgi:ABC-type multidrug transport system ATPase subunit